MAFARPAQQADENAPAARENKAGHGGKGQAVQGSRRALGDIGNLVGPFNTRCNVGKDGGKKGAVDAGAQAPKVTGILTRQRASAQGIVVEDQAPQWGQSKRRSSGRKEPEVTSVANAAPSGAGSSMSQLLAAHSEEALTSCKAPLSAASPCPDIDSADKGDPLFASEYASDIFSYYRRVEPLYRVAPDYMTRQTDINEKMRAILIDWLVEVHLKFKLMPETLFLTTNLIDRFLELKPVNRKNLQLVGVTAMLIASKYEEIWAPEVRDFVYISDKAYTREQILQMEKVMLNSLGFNLTVPTPNTFLPRFLKAAGSKDKPKVTTYASYLVELAMQESSMLRYPYSMVATAAVYLANMTMKVGEPLPYALQKHSGFNEATLRPCAVALAGIQRKAANASLAAVYKKFSSTKQQCVAQLPGPGSLIPKDPVLN